MLSNGVKRKLDEDGDVTEELGGGFRASLALQRQMVLNMSLVKLCGPQTGAGLNLQRQVLINNVIRHIHEDLKQEGGIRALFLTMPPGEIAAHARQLATPPPPLPLPSLGVRSSAPDSCLTPASVLEEDPPLFLTLTPSSSPLPVHHSLQPTPPSPSHKDSFSSALEDIEELGPLSSPPHTARALFEDPILKEEPQSDREEEIRVDKPRPPPFSISPPPLPPTYISSQGGFLTDFALDDILFTDIDTSMYDFGPCPPSATAAVSSSAAKMAPMVMSEELVRSISVGSSQNQPFKMDLAELDHIMEVLVGS
ncbi:SERTA domain-containing protein 2-like [Lampris incognitus]|uniref:SERTA domain-containing protein 2-like n=1 Tax=Lampris incognitus TaxID=2546036 RepID=UPI0024B48F1E|nr:SERTA domain-containing protein 2-like [Lampris incognitus]